MIGVRIRRADIDDQDDLHELHNMILPYDAHVDDDGNTFWWIAEDEGTPVAFAALSPSVQTVGGGYLSMAGVHAAYRGQGLQKRLIRVRLNYARKLGWNQVVTDTIPANPASINSLISCGFRSYLPDRPWKGEKACYWKRVLR